MKINAGDAERISRTFVQADFDRFATLTGDDNPIHVDPAFSARTSFGATVAHGMLLYSVVSAALGTYLPGPGTVQLEQELVFPSPTYAGEEVTIRLEVTEVRGESGLANLTTLVVRPAGQLGLQGRALVRLPGKSPYQDTPPAPQPSAGGAPAAQHLKGLEIGQRAVTRRTFTDGDLEEYLDLTGDANPVFTDERYARGLGLEGSVIPGSLLGGLFSYLLGTRLPGRGTNYLKQRLTFPAPAYPGEEITAAVEVIRLRPEKELVNVRTTCTNRVQETVCEGEALVLVRDVEGR